MKVEMKKIDPAVRSVVREALAACADLKIEEGSVHSRVLHTRSLDFVVLPGSASDYRASANLRSSLRRLAERGAGILAARRGLTDFDINRPQAR